jgi:hypothetical protein
MTRLCIVARGELMLYGYLTVALGRELEGPDRMEIIFDRRGPAAPPGTPRLGVERRAHPAVDRALQTQGYVILDESGNLVGPQLPASGGAISRWKSAGARVGERARRAWQARPAARSVVRLAGVLGVLGVSAILAGAQVSTHADRPVVLGGAESPMASAPARPVVVTSPPAVAASPPLIVPPGPMTLVPSPPAPVAVSSALADRAPELPERAPAPRERAPALPDREPALAEPLMRRPPAAAPPSPLPKPPRSLSR